MNALRKKVRKWMDTRFYGLFHDNWDDTLFRERLKNLFTKDSVCLDYGAGRGNVSQMNFSNDVQAVFGVDVDEAVQSNPYLKEAKVIHPNDGTLPFEDDKFDFVFSDNVMEHVENPGLVFKEIHRVLKPGGKFIAKTPNKWHYMPVIARSTPTWFHKFYNKIRGRKEFDTFPTRYKCNTEQDVHKHARQNNFKADVVEFWEGRPEYLRVWITTYLIGLLYERLVNRFDAFKRFRCVMYFEVRKNS